MIAFVDESLQAGRGYRVGGLAASIAAGLRLAIAAAFALTGLGATGDRAFGSFSGLTFIPTAALVAAAAGLYGALGSRIGGRGRFGLIVTALGLTLVAIGEFGGAWLGFARSGNFLIAPGHVLTIVGLMAFYMSTRRKAIPRAYGTLAGLIAVLPLAFLPLAAVVEVLRGGPFPPSLDDSYFRFLYVLTALAWLALGTTMLHDSAPTTDSA